MIKKMYSYSRCIYQTRYEILSPFRNIILTSILQCFREINISNYSWCFIYGICAMIFVLGCESEKEGGGIIKPIVTSGEREPVFSPDGNFIAYYSESLDEIWLFEITTEENEYLTNGRSPDWSPNGNQIVYAKVEEFEKEREIERIYHLWIMDADGQNKRQLTGRVTKTFGCK